MIRRRRTTGTDRAHRARSVRVVAVAVASVVVVSACVACSPGDPDDRGRPGATTAAAGSTTDRVPVVGAPTDVVEVKPPADHPLAGLDRDAGVSARLRDGSVVWFFGDTARVLPDRSLEFFVIGTAAWASADAPTTPLDAVVNGRPPAFAAPSPEAVPCTPMAPAAGAWPFAAVVVPDGPRDRVLVWVEDICLGDARNVESRGMSVGEWIYDPSRPHAEQPVTLRSLGSISTDRWFGYAATLGPDGWIYASYCEQFPAVAPDGTVADAPECRLARVRPGGVADRSAYEIRTDDGWEAAAERPAALVLPVTGDGPDARTVARPPGALSLGYHRGSKRWVMAYSPWPGQTPELHLRFAERPEGPWSRAVVVDLPDCETRTDGRVLGCYAGSLQPFLDTEGEIGIGWYDRIRVEDGVSGNYLVARVRLSAS